MKVKGAGAGAGMLTYKLEYECFEKKRIVENGKKTPKRVKSEQEFPSGRPLEDENKKGWVLSGRMFKCPPGSQPFYF